MSRLTRTRAARLIIAAAVLAAVAAGIYGYQNIPALSSNSRIQWGLYHKEPLQPPDPPPEGAALLQKYQGLYIADTTKKTVYFTYDLGYEAGYTSGVLDVLRDKKVHAIFFLCGHYIDNESPLVNRMLTEGHSIGNHTAKHKNPTQLSADQVKKDIMDLQTPFEEKYGVKMHFYRPPQGEFNEQALIIAQELNLHAVLWSAAYSDWQRDQTIGKENVIKTVMGRVHNGAIMLFHIASADVPAALPDLIDTLRAQGYTLGEPQDLLTFVDPSGAPPTETNPTETNPAKTNPAKTNPTKTNPVPAQ
ncbi:MAG: polysaccharide deacetylase family protein [Peptococcaceae bacterium]|nr:polysaccharide deacetylase family protein [Peptococcaceae bacterium]